MLKIHGFARLASLFDGDLQRHCFCVGQSQKWFAMEFRVQYNFKKMSWAIAQTSGEIMTGEGVDDDPARLLFACILLSLSRLAPRWIHSDYSGRISYNYHR